MTMIALAVCYVIVGLLCGCCVYVGRSFSTIREGVPSFIFSAALWPLWVGWWAVSMAIGRRQ